MGKREREKGKRGEREARDELGAILNVNARRGVQFQGGPDSPDVVLDAAIHVECKRTETLSVYVAMAQAQGDANEDNVPIVWHRRSRKPSLVIVQTSDLVRLAREVVRCVGMDAEDYEYQDPIQDGWVGSDGRP